MFCFKIWTFNFWKSELYSSGGAVQHIKSTFHVRNSIKCTVPSSYLQMFHSAPFTEHLLKSPLRNTSPYCTCPYHYYTPSCPLLLQLSCNSKTPRTFFKMLPSFPSFPSLQNRLSIIRVSASPRFAHSLRLLIHCGTYFWFPSISNTLTSCLMCSVAQGSAELDEPCKIKECAKIGICCETKLALSRFLSLLFFDGWHLAPCGRNGLFSLSLQGSWSPPINHWSTRVAREHPRSRDADTAGVLMKLFYCSLLSRLQCGGADEKLRARDFLVGLCSFGRQKRSVLPSFPGTIIAFVVHCASFSVSENFWKF